MLGTTISYETTKVFVKWIHWKLIWVKNEKTIHLKRKLKNGSFQMATWNAPSQTYVVQDFEGPDVGDLGFYEFPNGRLLAPRPLRAEEVAVDVHNVPPVVLQTV